MRAEVTAGLADPKIRRRFAQLGIEPRCAATCGASSIRSPPTGAKAGRKALIERSGGREKAFRIGTKGATPAPA